MNDLDILKMTDITPDEIVFWEWGLVNLNATIVFTWMVMALMALGAWRGTRNLSTGADLPRWQHLLEMFVGFTRDQIRDMARDDPRKFLPFIGGLFLFILVSNVLAVVPGFLPPTGSLSTTAALAIAVFVAVPVYGVLDLGVLGYLKRYVQPSVVMLPFNVIGELSRTLALAVRLFGNVMSGIKVAGILLAVAPLIFPVVMHMLGLLTGVIQAYIFAILAMVYIASGMRTRSGSGKESQSHNEEGAS